MSETHESLRPIRTTAGQVAKIVDRIAPPQLALPNDPIGWQLGDPASFVEKVAVALDASPKSVAAAAYHGAQMLVTHHPLIYRPLASVRFDDPVGSAVRTLCEKGISVYSAHTNWDVAEGGVNDALAEALELQDLRPLGSEIRMRQYKIVTFVPVPQTDAVIDAMAREGAGTIGNYRRCAFVHEGQGTFEPMEGAEPTIGKVGKHEVVKEHRIEMVADDGQLGPVLKALAAAHPYEEPAFDVYPIESNHSSGIGRVGRLPRPMSLTEFTQYASEKLSYPSVRQWGAPHQIVRSVAVVGGSGGDYLAVAKGVGADALLTGEVRHHHTWQAATYGIALVDAGHEQTEMPGVRTLALALESELAPRKVAVKLV